MVNFDILNLSHKESYLLCRYFFLTMSNKLYKHEDISDFFFSCKNDIKFGRIVVDVKDYNY